MSTAVAVRDEPIVAFAKDVLGINLYPAQRDFLNTIYRENVRTSVLRVGRRSGKSRVSAIIATYEATVGASRHRKHVVADEVVAVVVVATSRRQAQIVHRFIRQHLRVPALRALIEHETAEEITLTNRMVVMTLPASASGARGYAVCCFIYDELGWATGLPGSVNDPEEVYNGLVPSTSTFPEARIVLASTPRFASGFFYAICQKAAASTNPSFREIHGTTQEWNPEISLDWLRDQETLDAANYVREYLAGWESGIGAALDAQHVRAAFRPGEMLGPSSAHRYVISADLAFRGDATAVLVGHLEGQHVVVDRVEGWKGSKGKPLSVDFVLDSISTLSEVYRHAPVLIDQWSADAILQAFRSRGVNAKEKAWNPEAKWDALLATRRTLYSGRLSLPDHGTLREELLGLEVHPLPSGKSKVAAPSRLHDDYAMALLMLVFDLTTRNATAQSHSYIGSPGADVPVYKPGSLNKRGKRYFDKKPRGTGRD